MAGTVVNIDADTIRCDAPDDLREAPPRSAMSGDASASVAAFLRAHAGATFCAICLHEMIPFDRMKIEETAERLAAMPGFAIRGGTCSNCEQPGVVIGFASSSDDPDSRSPVATPYRVACGRAIEHGTGRSRTPAGDTHADCY